MIDPITGAALTEVMAGITGEMTGLSLADAWNQQQLEDPVDAGFGVDFGVGMKTTGYNKPAISGETENSIVDSQKSDPIEAFNDYISQSPSGVDPTTGGVVEGSKVWTLAYSLMQTHPTAGTEVIKAVVPVAIPIEQAYIAISQALGVSMDAAQMEVETKQAFADSIVNGNNLIYDKAKNLVKAWWDGVNILFPRETVQAVQNKIDELGIGGDEGYIIDGRSTNPRSFSAGQVVDKDGGTLHTLQYLQNGAIGAAFTNPGQPAGRDWIIAASNGVYSVKRVVTDSHGKESAYDEVYLATSYTYDGKTVWYTAGHSSNTLFFIRNFPVTQFSGTKSRDGLLAWAMIYGDRTPTGVYPEGTQESMANKYSPSEIPSYGGIAASPNETIDVVSINLPTEPFDTTESVADPIDTPTDSDEVGTLPLPPLPFPIPDTKPSNPDVPLVNPSVIDSTLIKELVDELANTLDPQPPQSSGIIPVPQLPGIVDPGTGQREFPSIIPASGPGFIHVYNPTPAEFVAFGNWLWVTYADATIDKILNNPFDGVIGAHELYATPNRDGRDNIRSAFLTCPTTADLVPNRYSEIDCGTVIVPEFYGNYLDYSPYSQAYIYLPFIGIIEVSIDDIVGHAVNIRYRVDSYSGSCIAMIFVAKDGYQNLCYQFAGSCSVEVPMAGGSQAAIKAAEMQAEAYAGAAQFSAIGHLFGGIGSALMGNIGGIIAGIGGVASDYGNARAGVEAARVANKSSVQHSGQFGSSHGAMGEKIPFIIIRNPIQVKVVNYNEDYGFPAHKRVILGGCRGYLRVREVNVISAHATDDEKAAIESLLKNGVYVS